MANNFYTVEKEINGKKYIAQFSGISTALKAADETYIEGTSNTSAEKMAAYLFEHIIVEPKGLTSDDFETMQDFNDVIAFARSVMQGDFRNKAVTGETKATGKK